MSLRTESILRTLRLLWDLLGRARFAVAAGLAILSSLSVLGLVHLFERNRDKPHAEKPAVAAASPTATAASASATPQDSPAAERVLAITEIKPKRVKLRDGSTQFAVTIGVAPRPQTKAGDVEIRVFFYDVTRRGELRPTDGQVAYAWLTPERDWSDPSPKFLEAIYLRQRHTRSSGERTRYGGFLVQVFSDGRLQDERGEPKQVLAALRKKASSPAPADDAGSPANEEPEDEEVAADNAEVPRNSDRQLARMTVEQTSTPAPTPSNAPYGKPAPNKPGFVYSPHDEKFIIDVRGVPPGTEIVDPNTGKPLRVP